LPSALLSQKLYCGDMIWSGHLISLLLPVLYVHRYMPGCCRALFIFTLGILAVGVLSFFISRLHFTIDVLLGYFFIIITFWIHESLSERSWFEEADAESVPIRAVWWSRLVDWFEQNVPPGGVPCELEWPLSFPDSCIRMVESLNASHGAVGKREYKSA